MAFEYFLYRTDLNNTVVDRSDSSFTPLPPNTNEIFVDSLVPDTQPLYFYTVVFGQLVPNSQANIDAYLKEIEPIPEQYDFVTYSQLTAQTSTLMFKYDSVIYVSKNGDDNNLGDMINKPKKTISSALTAATSGDTVVVLDGGVYDESLLTVDDVNIYAPYAYLDLSSNRELKLSKGVFRFRSIYRTSGSNIMIESQAASPLETRGYAILDLEEISDDGSGITIRNGLNRPLDLHIKQIYVKNNNAFLLDNQDSTSHTHITADDLYLYSSGCTGFELGNGGNIVGNIQHIKELGDGIGTSTAFNIVDGEINIIAPDCRATTIANIEPDGVFRFTSQRFSGAVNNNGGQYSYFTAGSDDGSMRMSTNLNISLDSDSITLPRQSGNTGSVLTVGTGGLLNYTTFTEPSLEWTDDTEGVTTVGTTTETTVYSITVDEDVSAGNISYQLTYTPAYFMLVTARLRRNDVNGTILNTTSFNGSGQQTLSYSLPLNSGTTISDGETIVLTIQFGAGAPANTVNDGGFLQAIKTGSAITTFSSITGNPLDNASLQSLFDDKAEKNNFESHTGDTTIHYPVSDININTNQITQNYINRNGELPHYTGTTTSGTTISLTDTSATWVVDEWKDKVCKIHKQGEDNDFEFGIISANTSNTLYFDDELLFVPCNLCTYKIIDTIVLSANTTNIMVALNILENDVGVILPEVTSNIEGKYVNVYIEKGNGGDTHAPLIGRGKDYQGDYKYGVLQYNKESVKLYAHTWDVNSDNNAPSTNPHWDITNLELIQRFLTGYWETNEQITSSTFEPYGAELSLITDRTRRFLPIVRSGIKYLRYQSIIRKVFMVDWGVSIFKDGGGAGETEIVIGIRRYETGLIEIQDNRKSITRFDGGDGYQSIRLRSPIELNRNDEVVCMALRTNGLMYINNGSDIDIIEL